MLISDLQRNLLATARVNAWVGNELLSHPELVSAEEDLMIAIAAEVEKRAALSSDDINNLFTFVFGKASEAVSLWENGEKPDTGINGIFSDRIPLYTSQGLLAIFRECDLPGVFAGAFLAAKLEGDPFFNLMSVLNMVWQLGIHIALASLGKGD
jgi:hypothetical protein